MKNRKRKRIIFLIISATFFVVILISLILAFFPDKENKMIKNLEKLGKEYYIDYWYPNNVGDMNTDEIEEYLSKYEIKGIKVNLDTLNNILRDEKDIMKIFKYKDKECNKSSTYFYFYPQKPYKDNDVNIEATLDCGFN